MNPAPWTRTTEPGPSHDCIINRGHRITSDNWTEFLFELEAILAELVIHRRAFVVLKVSGPLGLFVQLEVSPDGAIEAEAVSTMHRPCNCPAPRHLIPAAWQERLLQLGWRPYVVDWVDGQPGPNHRENFFKHSDPDWLWIAAMFSELLVRTLVEVYEVEAPTELTMILGSFRGDTAPRL